VAITPELIFGEIVYSLRKANDLTQEELAEQSLLSRDFISKLENGLRGPSIKVLSKLATPLNKTPLELHSIFLKRLHDEGIHDKWVKSRDR
jgi:transcriptional regulator with XRE-family HTH domain